MKDKLFFFKKAYSLEAPGHYYEAVIAGADGVVKKTLSRREGDEIKLRHGDDYELFDFSSYYCLPGFFDSHAHFMQTGYNSMAVRFENCHSVSDVQQKLFDEIEKCFKSGNKNAFSPASAFGGIIVGHGFDESNFSGGNMPVKADLEAVSKDIPIFISRIDHHSSVCNGAFMKLYPDFFYAVDENVKKTGILRREPNYRIKGMMIDNFDFNVRRRAYEASEKAALEAGITSVCALEGGAISGVNDVFFIDKVIREGINKLNIILFDQSGDFTRASVLGLPRTGGCLLVDGSFGSQTAAMSEAYAGSTDNFGALYLDEKFLTPFIESAQFNNLQAAFHAIGDRAINALLNSYEFNFKKFGGRVKNCLRHRIEHFEYASDSDIKRAADMAIVLSMQPVFETLWGGANGMYAARLGSERAFKTNRFKTIIQAGGIIAGGSDSDVTPFSPIAGIGALVNLPNEKERAGIYDAVSIFTKNGAYANFCERERGSLSINKFADFTLLDKDIFNTPASEIKNISVTATITGGKLRYFNPAFQPA